MSDPNRIASAAEVFHYARVVDLLAHRDRWTLVLRVRDGHAFWREPKGGTAIAVTDRSLRVAGEPHLTDDGLLLLDTARPILGSAHDSMIDFTLPVYSTRDQAEAVSPASPEEAALVAKLFNVPIEIRIGSARLDLIRRSAKEDQ